MKCPYCDTNFPLTWGRYWRAPMGRHLCPVCRKTSRLPVSLSYIALALLGGSVGGVPLAVTVWHWYGGRWAVIGGFVGGLFTAVPIDKIYLDGRYRKLERLERGARTV
jgi:hypothetical protein